AFQVFDREAKKKQKDRAAYNKEQSRLVDYLKDEVAARVADRLLDIKREFGTVVDLGSGCGHIVKHVDSDMMQKLIMCDMSVDVERKIVDEEHLPFEEDSLEAVVSSLSLNWVNDLPGALIQIRKSLKPDGVFIGAMFGGDTLFELR
ncbi:S-adenosyl-L-methionine-dependent methyltransferase, partial [Cunninghamella echinulata]